MSKQFIYRNYQLMFTAFMFISVVLIFLFYSDQRIFALGSLFATGLAFLYFIHQQRLAETTLFQQLFTDFNKRYDKLNGKLEKLINNTDEFNSIQKSIVVDYFNLCAEEYLFYKKGYIYPEVWASWCRGMLYYLNNESFRTLWDQEVKTNSYYGLSIDKINEGSRLTD